MLLRLLALFLVYGCVRPLWAQTVPAAELDQRHKLNATHFAEYDYGVDLVQQAARTNHDVLIGPFVKEHPGVCVDCPKPDPYHLSDITLFANLSDVVLIGRVISQTSSFTPNNTYVFTDSQMLITEVWRQSGKNRELAGPVLRGTEITVTSPGGEVTIQGHRIVAAPSRFTPFVPGHEYLLFLKYLPDSRSYIQVSPDGFDVTTSPVVPIRRTYSAVPEDLLLVKSVFLDALHSSTNDAGQGGNSGGSR